MSLRDKVLATIGTKIKEERAAIEAKAKAKAEGKTVAGERMPKMPKSKSGDFMNIRHLGEYLMIAVPEITPGAFATMIHNEFPESAAGSSKAQAGKELGHFPYYRRYVLDGNIKFAEAIKKQLEEDGIDFEEQVKTAQAALEETITRRKKTEEEAVA